MSPDLGKFLAIPNNVENLEQYYFCSLWHIFHEMCWNVIRGWISVFERIHCFWKFWFCVLLINLIIYFIQILKHNFFDYICFIFSCFQSHIIFTFTKYDLWKIIVIIKNNLDLREFDIIVANSHSISTLKFTDFTAAAHEQMLLC